MKALIASLRISRVKAAVILFGISFPYFICAGLNYIVQGEREREIDIAFKETANYARMFEEHTVRTITGLDQVALFIKYQVEKEGVQIDLPRLLSEGRFSGQPLGVLAVIDKNGVLAASSRENFARVDNSDLEAFQVHKGIDTGKLFISKPVFGRVTGKWLIQMSRRINLPDGSFGGAVVLGVDPYYFAQFYREVDLGENSVITLVGSDGIVRVRQSGDEVKMGLDFRRRVNSEFSRGKAGNYIDSAIADGIKRLFSYRNLAEYPLTVVAGTTEAQVFRELDRRATGYYYAGASLSGLVVLFIGTLLFSIDRRERLEMKLRESEARFSLSMQATRDGLWDWDLRNNSCYFSPGYYHMLGYEENEFPPEINCWIDLIHPDDRTAALQSNEDCINGRCEGFEAEFRMKNKNGEWQWILSRGKSADRDRQGRAVRLVGTHVDITDRKRAEKALQASEQRYRSLLMQAYDAVILFDLETLEIVEVNAAFERMTGYRFPLTKPLKVFDLVVDEPVNIMRYLDEMHTNGVLHPALRKIRTCEGGVRLVERTGNRLEIGGRDYQLTTFRDVTQERTRQQQMHKDLVLAAQVQRALLPAMPRSDSFLARSIFKPQGFVSGDVYSLQWNEAEKVLRGILVDITGHGMATALQTAAVNVLLHQMADLPEQTGLPHRLNWLNRRISPYIDEGAFAAAIGFELDFTSAELRYASAGINHFLHNGERIDVEGLYLGIRENEAYDQHRRSLLKGDAVCFMTDGISDIFDRENSWGTIQANELIQHFDGGSLSEQFQDDATAICIEIR